MPLRRDNSASHHRSSVVSTSVKASDDGLQPGLRLPRLAVHLGQQGEEIRLHQLRSHAGVHCPPLTDLRHGFEGNSLHGQCPASQDTSLLQAEGKSLLGREGHQRFGMCLCRRYVSAAVSEPGGIEMGKPQRGRMPHLRGQRQRLLTPLLGLVRIAQPPHTSAIQASLVTLES